MSVLGTYTLRTLKKNPVRTVVTMVGIALATALIFAVITSALSLYTYLIDVETTRSGTYNGVVDGITAEQLQQLEEAPGVTAVASVQLEGYALVNEANSLTPYIVIEGLVPHASDGLDAMAAFEVTEGCLPQTTGEILLPATLKRSGVLDVAIGDTVTFDVGTRVDDSGTPLYTSDPAASSESWELTERLVDTAPRAFTVCGFYGDSNPLFWVDEYGGSVAGLPAFTMATPLSEAPQGAVYQAWVNVSDPGVTGSILAQAFAPDTVSMRVNSYMNRMTSFNLSVGGYRTVFGFMVLVLGVVIISSLLLVRTSFSISVSERTRQFGLLSSVGATRRQLRGMVMREALGLSLIAIPVGLLIGYAGTAVVLEICRGLVADWSASILDTSSSRAVLHVVVAPVAVVGSVLLGLATTLVSAWGPARRAGRMSAIDAIRSSADVRIPAGVRRSGRLAQKVFGVEGAIAAKSFRRAKKPRRATIAALVTGTVLVATASLLGAYVTEVLTTAKPEVERTYDLQYWFSDANISGANGQKATPQEVVDQLMASDGITEAASGVQLVTSSQTTGPGIDGVYTEMFIERFADRLNMTVLFVDDSDFCGWLEEQGIDPTPYLDPRDPRAVAVNSMDGIEDDRYVRFEPFTGMPFEFVGVTEVSVQSDLGDAASPYPAEENNDGGFVAAWHSVSFEVDRFVNQGPWWLGTPSAPVFLLPLSAMKAVDPTLVSDDSQAYYNRFWEVWVRSDDPAATEQVMRSRLQALGLSSSRLYNLTTSSAGLVSLFNTAQVFIWAFAVIVTLIAVTSAFNTMVTSVGLRRREFAVLRSVGLTKRGLYKMLACECFMYSLRVLLWAIPASCLISLGLWYASSATVSGMAYRIPWMVLAAALGAFVVVCAATAYAARSVDATSPVQALRSENA